MTTTVLDTLTEFMRLYEDGKLGTDPEVINAYNEAVQHLPASQRSSGPLESAFRPTHQHADGGFYQSLGHGKVRMEEAWVDGWFYRADDGAIYATSLLRWNARFTPISSSTKGD